jgi:hypothetical protein
MIRQTTLNANSKTIFAAPPASSLMFPALFLLATGIATDALATPSRLSQVNAFCAQRQVTVSCDACHVDLGAKLNTPTAGKNAYNADKLDFFCPAPAANTPPTLKLSPSGDQALAEGQAAKPVKAAASDSDPVSISIAPNPLPAGADWNAATGVLNYTPPLGTAAATPTLTFTFTATDAPSDGAAPQSVTQNLSFHISPQGAPINHPPSITVPASVNATVGDGAFKFEAAASDPDGDPVEMTAANLPNGLNFSLSQNAAGESVGIFSWAPNGPTADQASSSPYVISLIAKDSNNAQSSKEIKLYVNAKPGDNGTGSVYRLNIQKAYWTQKKASLEVSGRAIAAIGASLAGLPVRVSDASSGALLGETTLNARGAWHLKISGIAAPCLVQVEAGGQIALKDVDRAPSNCQSTDEGSVNDHSGNDNKSGNDSVNDHSGKGNDDEDGNDNDGANGEHDGEQGNSGQFVKEERPKSKSKQDD